jgi:hypothetical protein
MANRLTSTTETKPGVYTTEFWISLFTAGASAVDLLGLANFVPDKYSAIVLAIVTAAYSVSRGQAKSGVKP